MHGLRELQRGMARSLLTGANPAFESGVVGDAIAAAERTAIYRNTFTGVMVGALRIAYPIVEKLVGAEFFEAAARRFLDAEAPHTAYLNDYGAGFDRFLAGFAPAASLPYLPDVAALEWAISTAALAEDAAAIDVAALAAVPAERLVHYRLTPHPSLRILRLTFPADTIWQAVRTDDDAAMAAIRLAPDNLPVAVHRGPEGVVLRRLSAGEARLTEALVAGLPLGEALAAAPEIEGMAILAEHLACGRFAGWRR